jgi:hypothetical protein
MPAIDHKELNTDDARQGVELGSVRWVLSISLALTVLAGVVLYLTFFKL